MNTFTPVLDSTKKHFNTINKTYQNNTDSDYTEKIEHLAKNFNYNDHRDYYWGPVELSTLYGTPLYEQASPSQKLALNHLYWVGQYNHTSAAEANTMLYNQVTSGVFNHFPCYETLCQELDLETAQEKVHIRAFQKIGYKTKLELLGLSAFKNPVIKPLKTHKTQGWLTKQWHSHLSGVALNSMQESTFRVINQTLLKNQANYYSQYLQDKNSNGEGIPITSGGLASITASPSIFKFFTLSWGSSPFLACQYYSARMIANMSLKTYEHHYFKHYMKLEKKGEFLPTPTAISYYHLLDESFHTTMSQVISQEVYKDFSRPNLYETFLANLIVYLAQKGILGGLSGGIPVTFRSDAAFMLPLYRLLQSSLFEMSTQDAVYWMKRCLGEEHQGFHNNLKYHQNLLGDFQRFFSKIDYLWSINQEMRLMSAGGSIDKAIQSNLKALEQFFQTVA